jgi:hypothetical protein
MRRGKLPMAGQFWHNVPTMTVQRMKTTRNCAVLLQLVQYLSQEEGRSGGRQER